jgi:hypothetical protein
LRVLWCLDYLSSCLIYQYWCEKQGEIRRKGGNNFLKDTKEFVSPMIAID